jgi:hypothetical protein
LALPFVPDGVAERGLRLAPVTKFFAYGLSTNNGIRARIRSFAGKWIPREPAKPGDGGRLTIHSDGEAYVRVALSVRVFETIIDAIGFRTFTFSHTPLWSFMEYVPEEQSSEHREAIVAAGEELRFTGDPAVRRRLEAEIAAHRAGIREQESTVRLLRDRLARPLYAAARIPLPHPVKGALERAGELLPTGKPYGELLPYVGESLERLQAGTDLILNLAPAGCMVATMGGVMHPLLLAHAGRPGARMATVLTQDGEVDRDLIEFALLKQMGPERYYRQVAPA